MESNDLNELVSTEVEDYGAEESAHESKQPELLKGEEGDNLNSVADEGLIENSMPEGYEEHSEIADVQEGETKIDPQQMIEEFEATNQLEPNEVQESRDDEIVDIEIPTETVDSEVSELHESVHEREFELSQSSAQELPENVATEIEASQSELAETCTTVDLPPQEVHVPTQCADPTESDNVTEEQAYDEHRLMAHEEISGESETVTHTELTEVFDISSPNEVEGENTGEVQKSEIELIESSTEEANESLTAEMENANQEAMPTENMNDRIPQEFPALTDADNLPESEKQIYDEQYPIAHEQVADEFETTTQLDATEVYEATTPDATENLDLQTEPADGETVVEQTQQPTEEAFESVATEVESGEHEPIATETTDYLPPQEFHAPTESGDVVESELVSQEHSFSEQHPIAHEQITEEFETAAQLEPCQIYELPVPVETETTLPSEVESVKVETIISAEQSTEEQTDTTNTIQEATEVESEEFETTTELPASEIETVTHEEEQAAVDVLHDSIQPEALANEQAVEEKELATTDAIMANECHAMEDEVVEEFETTAELEPDMTTMTTTPTLEHTDNLSNKEEQVITAVLEEAQSEELPLEDAQIVEPPSMQQAEYVVSNETINGIAPPVYQSPPPTEFEQILEPLQTPVVETIVAAEVSSKQEATKYNAKRDIGKIKPSEAFDEVLFLPQQPTDTTGTSLNHIPAVGVNGTVQDLHPVEEDLFIETKVKRKTEENQEAKISADTKKEVIRHTARSPTKKDGAIEGSKRKKSKKRAFLDLFSCVGRRSK